MTDTIDLTAHQVGAQLRVPMGLQRIRWEKHEDPTMGDLCYQLTAYVMSEKVHEGEYTKSFTFNFPTDWWQMWKGEHAPKWFVKRWPIAMDTVTKTVTVNVEHWVGYPELPMTMPDCGHQMRFLKMREDKYGQI